MKINFKKLHPDAKEPLYGTSGAAGADVFTIEEVTIKPKELAMISTGISFEIPEGYFAMVAPRSSLCLKKHLDMPNSVGIGDKDYRGEYFIPLRNLGDEEVIIEKGERIAQIIFIPYEKVTFNEVDELTVSERKGGFGSTGKF